MRPTITLQTFTVTINNGYIVFP